MTSFDSTFPTDKDTSSGFDVARSTPSEREITAEEFAPNTNYSAYTLKRFARVGIISAESARKDCERSNAWVFKPSAALAELESAYRLSHRLPVSVSKKPKR